MWDEPEGVVKTEEVALAGVVRPDILGGGGRGLELMVWLVSRI